MKCEICGKESPKKNLWHIIATTVTFQAPQGEMLDLIVCCNCFTNDMKASIFKPIEERKRAGD